MKRFFLRSKVFHFLAVVTASCLIAIFFSRSQFGTTVEGETLDWRMRVASGSRHPDSSVVIAAIDQNSLAFFQKNGVAWPWPREFYGILLDYLHEGAAKAVVFDMDFSQKDMDRVNVDAAGSDSSFASGIRESGNVVLISVLTGSRDSADSIQKRFFLDGAVDGRAAPKFTSCVAPRMEFQEGAQRIGAANYVVDIDGVARRIPLLFRLDNRFLPQLSLAAYAVGNGRSADQLTSFIGSIPVDRGGDYLINWYGKGGPQGVFKYYSMSALIISAVQLKQGIKPEIAPSVFRNKYVIVGGSAIGLMDFVSTPFTSLEPFPGAEIHATILSNFLQRDYLRQPPSAVSSLIVLALSVVAAGVFFRMRRALVSTAIVIASCVLYFLAAFLIMSTSRIWLPLVGPEISALSAFAFAGVISYVTEGRQRRELRKLMNRYLSPDVVDEISSDPETVDFKGKEVEATVFFSDIRDFTSVSERLQPRELVENLNEYFTLATELILNNGAMLDKYIGDAIMAVFGAPLPRRDHAAMACLTALQVQDTLSGYYA
ncbi:MAG TPA: adenylate/guanylate cyclase domain-containing protein, partial [Candidatus Kryptobacter bacterium]|nr:adenylate/guanylate cyclase domain-containing protein [Candidatus Kryptobacter bacterium]